MWYKGFLFIMIDFLVRVFIKLKDIYGNEFECSMFDESRNIRFVC